MLDSQRVSAELKAVPMLAAITGRLSLPVLMVTNRNRGPTTLILIHQKPVASHD